MVKYRRAEGCTTVEMECAALAACARKRGASFGQILYAADSLANVLEHDERDWGKGLLTESTGTLYRSAASDLKVQVPLRMLGHTARTRTRFSKREGSGTFFVYGKSYGESTQNGKREQVKAGYHHGRWYPAFCAIPSPKSFSSLFLLHAESPCPSRQMPERAGGFWLVERLC